MQTRPKGTSLQLAKCYLESHPDTASWSSYKLAAEVSEPKVSRNTWAKAQRRIGLSTTGIDFAINHLRTHPELHHTSCRDLSRLVTERKLAHSVWSDAKQALGIPAFRKGRKKVNFEPRKQVQETTTFALDALNGKVIVKSTAGVNETHVVCDTTMEFLAWLLMKKRYSYRSSMHGIVFTKLERSAQ